MTFFTFSRLKFRFFAPKNLTKIDAYAKHEKTKMDSWWPKIATIEKI